MNDHLLHNDQDKLQLVIIQEKSHEQYVLIKMNHMKDDNYKLIRNDLMEYNDLVELVLILFLYEYNLLHY